MKSQKGYLAGQAFEDFPHFSNTVIITNCSHGGCVMVSPPPAPPLGFAGDAYVVGNRRNMTM